MFQLAHWDTAIVVGFKCTFISTFSVQIKLIILIYALYTVSDSCVEKRQSVKHVATV